MTPPHRCKQKLWKQGLWAEITALPGGLKKSSQAKGNYFFFHHQTAAKMPLSKTLKSGEIRYEAQFLKR